ncbi:MAG: tripartite tricarboxylate transporter TctB family protein, partial [Candidatus Rokuibacteriota bacterium]
GVVLFDALRLGVGWSTDGPMSGFFPFWLSVCLLGLCGVIFVRTLARRPAGTFTTGERTRRVLSVLAPATALVALTQVIGLYVASTLYLAFYMRWVGRHSWLLIAVVAVGVPLGLFVVFERWFLVPLPKGPLEDWLGY